MDSTEIERIANDVVRGILAEGIGYLDISDREDCYDIPELDLRAIHDRAVDVLSEVAARFRAEVGDGA